MAGGFFTRTGKGLLGDQDSNWSKVLLVHGKEKGATALLKVREKSDRAIFGSSS